MTEAIVIFAVIFGACMFAIGAFVAAQWVDPSWRTMPPAMWTCPTPEPYSPPLVRNLETVGKSDAERVGNDITITAHNLGQPNPATFQDFAADSADDRGVWGPTA